MSPQRGGSDVLMVEGPPSVLRAGSGPAFTVLGDEPGFFALEVAIRPALLAPEGRPGGGPTAGFHGTWLDGPLQPGPVLYLPAVVWDELRPASRLWYRALWSAAAGSWVAVVTSVPDDRVEQAPWVAVVDVTVVDATAAVGEPAANRLDEVWRAVVEVPDAAALSRQEAVTVALVRHVDRAGRPRAPKGVGWVAVLSVPSPGRVDELVVRVREPDHAVEVLQATQAPPRAVAATDLLEVELGGGGLAGVVKARPNLLRRTGPILLWQDLGPPPPDGVGGTVVVSGLTGELLFSAPTVWAHRASDVPP